MDCIAETAGRVRARDPRFLFDKEVVASQRLLAIYPDLANRLVGAPRFLFDHAAIRTAVELTLGRPKVMLEALQHIRIPYPKLWVEWEETGRERLRQQFATEIIEERPLPDRVGFFLECDANGRAGRAIWAWTALGQPVPNVGPFGPFFDLDAAPRPQPQARVAGLLHANLAKHWVDNPVQTRALLALWETAEHVPIGPWADYYLRELKQRQGDWGIGGAMADVYGELIQLYACLLLLTSSRKIVELEPVSMAKLNKARVKRHEVPKLDYTKVSMYLDPAVRERQRRAPLGYTRKSPRVHYVQSYLARRGNRHWITIPYIRGQGEWVTRHIRVRG